MCTKDTIFQGASKIVAFNQCKLENLLNKYDGNARSVCGPQTNGMALIHTEDKLKILTKSAKVHECSAVFKTSFGFHQI